MIFNLTENLFITIAMQLKGSLFTGIAQEALSGQMMKRPAVAFKNVQPV